MNAAADTGPGRIDDAAEAASALDDALYHLRRGCEPCAERYFDRARRYGATTEQVEAVRSAAAHAD